MPLIHKSSKKALQKNIETEMRAHPEPSRRDQNLAIAYSVKRKAPKKARGGLISPHLNEEKHANHPEQMEGSFYSKGGMASPSAASGMRDTKEHGGIGPKPKSLREKAIEAFEMASRDKAQPHTHSDEEEHGREEMMLQEEGTDERSRMAEGGEAESDADDDMSVEEKQAYNDQVDQETDDIEERAKRHIYADGGEVEIDAKHEERPMPERDEHADSDVVRANRHKTEIDNTEHSWSEKRWEEVGRSRSESPNDSDISAVDEHMTDIDDAEDSEDLHMMREEPTDPEHIDSHHDEDIKRAKFYIGGYADGEMVEEPEHKSVASAVRHRMKRKMYASGGHVDPLDSEGDQAEIERNAREYPNSEDDYSFNSLKKENYSEKSNLRDQPRDSNQKAIRPHDADEANESMISAIRKKMARRQG